MQGLLGSRALSGKVSVPRPCGGSGDLREGSVTDAGDEGDSSDGDDDGVVVVMEVVGGDEDHTIYHTEYIPNTVLVLSLRSLI